MGARQVPLQIHAGELTIPIQQGTAKMPALSASASIREKRVTVTLTNPSVDTALATRIRLSGSARAVEARGTVLTHGDMRARNTFDAPEEVRPVSLSAKASGDSVTLDLPKHSVAAVEMQLA
jgi:alpha-N-arabinofuranosidase